MLYLIFFIAYCRVMHSTNCSNSNIYRSAVSRTAVYQEGPGKNFAAAMEKLQTEYPKDQQERNFGAEMEKLEKECEERMDAKVAELMANIDKEIPDVKKGTPEEAEAVEDYLAQK